jgi:hypothetical protein
LEPNKEGNSCLLSGGTPDSHYRRSGADLLPFLAQLTVGSSGWLAHRTLSGAHRCNALNLGVEFFLLFSHQIRALFSFLFPRFAHSSQFQTSIVTGVRVMYKPKPKCHGCCIMPKHFLGLMLSVRLVPFRISICDLISFSGPRASWVFDPRSGPAQPSPA